MDCQLRLLSKHQSSLLLFCCPECHNNLRLPLSPLNMTTKPTLVFVQGSWYPVDSWNKLTSLLEARQYKCVCVASPSAQSNPEATFYDDVVAVRKAIEAETTQGRDVVVIVHSYGSLPGNSAAKGLTLPKDGASAAASGGRRGGGGRGGRAGGARGGGGEQGGAAGEEGPGGGGATQDDKARPGE